MKRGPARSNPKAKAKQLADDWEALLARHSKPLERGAKSFGIKSCVQKIAKPEVEQIVNIQRDPHGMMGPTPKAPPKIYTGTAMIGLATMHKSNTVPIFNAEAAVDVATMRRN